MAATEVHLGDNGIHLDDIGTVFTVTLKDGDDIKDISAATTKQFIFRKPSETKVTKTASFVTDGSDGQIRYTTVADDLDEAGKWYIQPYIVFPNWLGHSDIGTFRVHPNLS